MNVHAECQDQVGKCQPKSRLLRRQRSTSEIESKQMDAGEEDSECRRSCGVLGVATRPHARARTRFGNGAGEIPSLAESVRAKRIQFLVLES